MPAIDHREKKGYNPAAGQADDLIIEKGYCHFTAEGHKDFVNAITAYQPESHGVLLEAVSFRGKKVLIRISFAEDTVFRFTMLPEGVDDVTNSVFSFPQNAEVTVCEDETFVIARTHRLELTLRKIPWEMTVYLDGQRLTGEQIKDFNVDQRYKSLPVGFAVDDFGKVLHTFETMYLHCNEDFYGFGEKFTSFNKRGQKLTIWQRDAGSTNSEVSYKGMPYFMSSQGYSIFLNTFSRTHFNMGADSGISYTMEAEDPYLDYYMICSRDYLNILEQYTALTGRSPMIPRWAFGFWMSRMSYMTRQEVEETVDRMAAFGMSADVIHIDAWADFFTGGSGELLSFDEQRFPRPAEMVRNLAQKGIHLSLWMFPYVNVTNPDGSLTQSFVLMKARNYLIKRPDGEVYTFMPGEGDANHSVAALDFTNPQLVEYMTERVANLMRMGVGVIKTDFAEEIPADAVLFDGTTGAQSHNRYPLLYAKTIYEASRIVKEEMGQKPMLWGRSGYLGSQNYPANWAGDSSSALNNQAAILSGGLSIGISGVSFWGFDIGGFYNCDYEGNRVIPSDEEYIRSVQMGLMSPLSRAHGQSTPREPWVFSKTAQAAFLKINKLRYRMLPYLYSTAWETVVRGIPMMRALLLEYPRDLTVRNIGYEYMLGEALLVAPVLDQQEHMVYLPKGSWIDMEHGTRVSGGDWLPCEKRIDVIPLFLRENRGIFLLEEAPMHITEKNFQDLTFTMNLTDSLEQVYRDDGLEGRISAKRTSNTVEVLTVDIPLSKLCIYSDAPVTGVTVNGQRWDTEQQAHCVLAFPKV